MSKPNEKTSTPVVKDIRVAAAIAAHRVCCDSLEQQRLEFEKHNKKILYLVILSIVAQLLTLYIQYVR